MLDINLAYKAFAEAASDFEPHIVLPGKIYDVLLAVSFFSENWRFLWENL